MSGLLPRNRALHPPALTPEYRSTRLRAPLRPLVALPSTLSEETGPVFGHGMLEPNDSDLIVNFTGTPALGERVIVHGQVRDEDARAIPGALIEIWQANAGGRYRHKNDSYLAPLDPNFGGAGRTLTDDQGRYRFLTVRPGAYPWPNGGNNWRPMHIHFSLFGAGFGQRLITQMYFEGDPLIALCPIAQTVPEGGVDRLVARLDMDTAIPMDALAYRFDIVLRGRDQTMFENCKEGL